MTAHSMGLSDSSSSEETDMFMFGLPKDVGLPYRETCPENLCLFVDSSSGLTTCRLRCIMVSYGMTELFSAFYGDFSVCFYRISTVVRMCVCEVNAAAAFKI
ncbi:unnamed protein product [Phytomonas sp. EM1]|nr:unnamed protein product [Phytomonas sp. EM1]|eukprot:CCW64906.1 unnamed protein product [Phytomonas sp. isolate EM1]